MVGIDPLLTLLFGGYSEPTGQAPMVHFSDRGSDAGLATVAEEVPVAFVYNGRAYTVVMATPLDLEDLAVGFSVTERIVTHADALERLAVVRARHGIEIQIELSSTDADRLSARSRTMVTRTGCGLCGVEAIDDMLHVPEKIAHTIDISRGALWLASRELAKRQTLNNETHSVHAAAWANQSGEILFVREDVGRHNALDKVLGALARTGTPVRDGFVVVTSRASYEMVQKAAMFGVELIAAVSRPTALAVRFAALTGVTLVALLRGDTANVYTNAERIT
jgi:FdhD protein